MPTFSTALQFLPVIPALGLEVEEAVENEEFEPLVYLLDAVGADLGYHFEWEAFGPYSQALVRDLTEITDQDLKAPELTDKANLDATLVEPVEKLKALIEPPLTLSVKRSQWLRLLAAVHFLQYRSGVEVGNGRRAPFVDRYFDQTAIASAKERLGSLVS